MHRTRDTTLQPQRHPIIFCETNDGTNDYYYFEINDLTLDPNDRFYLLFDNIHDGTIAACGVGIPVEDAIGYIQPPPRPLPSPFIDMHYCGLPFTDQPPAGADSNQDITAIGSFTSGIGYRFEFSHPLNSGDGEDYALSFGSTLGWCIYWKDARKPPPNIVEYPPDCYSVYAGSGSAGMYGHVVKQGEHTTTRTTVTVTTTRTTTATTTSIVTTTVVEPTVITNTTTVTTTVPTTTTTTATTTSIIIDPMLENKLYIVIALLLAIIGLIWWLYWKCCKKKWPGPSVQSEGGQPPPPSPASGLLAPNQTSTILLRQIAGDLARNILLGTEVVEDYVKSGRTDELRVVKSMNNSRANTLRLSQMVTDPTAQQAVAEGMRCFDELEEELKKGNREEAVKLLDKAAACIRRSASILNLDIAVSDPGVPND